MKMVIVTLLSLFIAYASPAQIAKKSLEGYFKPPLEGVLLPSANFAETRSNHFHSGVDIKTGGVVGKPLYATADGYISRIGIAPRGFGRVLYINHPNGTTTVYAHMQKFTPAVEKYVKEQRYKQKKHAIDIYCEAGMFPVKQGEFIGNSGNSGSSGGPHLHYEVRDAATQEPINPVRRGMVTFKDNIPPTIVRLHYIEVDTVRGVALNSKPRAIEVAKTADGNYILKDTSALVVGPRGYFVLEATDRKNDSQNTMGIYRVATTLDGRTIFSFRLDRFSYANTRYVNSLCHFQMQKGARNQFLRLAVQEGNRLPIYSKIRNRGAVVLNDAERHPVVIEVEDDNDNKVSLSFNVRRRAEERQFWGEQDLAGLFADCRKAFNADLDGFRMTIPENVLYEPIFCKIAREDEPNIKGGNTASFPRYSPVFSVHNASVPLHKAMTVSIDAPELPENLRAKACLGIVAADGANISYMGGSYKDGSVTGNTSMFGRYCVVTDTLPPAVTPNFTEGQDLRGKSSLAFTLKDNFSGIASFEATIDGQWIIFEQQGSTITHHFDPEKVTYTGGKHTLEITVKDNKGNTTSLTRQFIR